MQITYMLKGTHKAHGWTRELILRDGFGSGTFRIVPTDGSGERIVEFISAHSWSNNPRDNRENIGRDRIILNSGPELPPWAHAWLTTVHTRSCQRAREAFADAILDADTAEARREGW